MTPCQTPIFSLSQSPLTRLLSHYVEGRFTEHTWRRLKCVLYAPDVCAEVRLSLARYVNDVLDALGTSSLSEAVLAEATTRWCKTYLKPTDEPEAAALIPARLAA